MKTKKNVPVCGFMSLLCDQNICISFTFKVLKKLYSLCIKLQQKEKLIISLVVLVSGFLFLFLFLLPCGQACSSGAVHVVLRMGMEGFHVYIVSVCTYVMSGLSTQSHLFFGMKKKHSLNVVLFETIFWLIRVGMIRILYSFSISSHHS